MIAVDVYKSIESLNVHFLFPTTGVEHTVDVYNIYYFMF